MTSTWWKIATVAVIVGLPFLVGAYDLAAYLIAGNDFTISRTCLNTAGRYPALVLIVGFLFGVLCGHLFVPQHVGPGQ